MPTESTEIVPNVFQLKIPIPGMRLGYTMPYLIKGDDGHLLIDTGLYSEEGINSFKTQLVDEIRIDPKQIKLILITHNHPDHYGLVKEVKELTQAPVAMHESDWNDSFFIRSKKKNTSSKTQVAVNPLEMMKKWFRRNGVPEKELSGSLWPSSHENQDKKTKKANPKASTEKQTRWDPTNLPEPDIQLKGDEVFKAGSFSIRAIWTPGHTPGHLCFYESKSNLLFTGDHVLPRITSNVSARMDKDGDPLGDYISSLEKLSSLDVDLVLPAHEYSFNNLDKRIEDLVAHHTERLDEVVSSLNKSNQTAYEIAQQISWNVGTWDQMDRFLRRSAAGETLSHLEHLKNKGLIYSNKTDTGLITWGI